MQTSNSQTQFQRALISPSSDKDNSKFTSLEEALEFLVNKNINTQNNRILAFHAFHPGQVGTPVHLLDVISETKAGKKAYSTECETKGYTPFECLSVAYDLSKPTLTKKVKGDIRFQLSSF